MTTTTLSNDDDLSNGKSVTDLAREALWFALHTLIAIGVLLTVLAVMTITQPDPDSPTPKLLATFLAFLLPLIVGFIVARLRPDHVARYVWLSGLLLFAIVCVWVLDLPTGVGLCEKCGAAAKLTRTFFAFDRGSGLLGGDGLLFGTWIPLSVIAYSLGARFAGQPDRYAEQ